jgi:hypothetical protein
MIEIRRPSEFGMPLIVLGFLLSMVVLGRFLPLVECPFCHGVRADALPRNPEGLMTRTPTELSGVCFQGKASLFNARRIRRS